MTPTYLTLQDITSLILCITGVIVLMLLMVCLFYLIGVAKRVGIMLKKGEPDLNEFMNNLPQTLKKVDSAVEGIGELVEAVKPAVKSISGAIDETAATVSDINTKVLGRVVDVKWIFDILTTCYNYVSNKFGKGTERH